MYKITFRQWLEVIDCIGKILHYLLDIYSGFAPLP